jgi:hypothetical protein
MGQNLKEVNDDEEESKILNFQQRPEFLQQPGSNFGNF